MQLTYINGSPRGKKGNTDKFMNNFVKGFTSIAERECTVLYLNQYRNKTDQLADIFWKSENVIIGFPLYVDGVPGSLKKFLEGVYEKRGGKGPKTGYMGQCGFPETNHMRFVERYLEKFTRRTGCAYLGSIMKGGGEGLHIQPEVFTEKTFNGLFELGCEFGETGLLNESLLAKISHPEQLSHEQIAGLVPYVNENLWDRWLKENNALEKSFNRPYKA